MSATPAHVSAFIEAKPGSEASPYATRLLFDRRRSRRVALEGRAMAAITDPSGGVAIATVELIDESVDGIGLASSVAIREGSWLTLYNGPRSLAERAVVRRVAVRDGVYLIGCTTSASRAAA
jgi:hypothetical protein